MTELTAGSFMVVNCESLAISKKIWWNINDYYKQQNNDSIEEALKKTDGYLHAAVKRRIESSDLEVGCFLSGGIDSGIITSIASRIQ